MSERYGDTFISIEDIRSLPEAHGLFNHPGDEGMAMLADRFFEHMKESLVRIATSK